MLNKTIVFSVNQLMEVNTSKNSKKVETKLALNKSFARDANQNALNVLDTMLSGQPWRPSGQRPRRVSFKETA